MQVLNQYPIDYLDRIPCKIRESKYYLKNAPYARAMTLLSDEHCSILSAMYSTITDFKKYQLADVKYHSLKVGENPANGLWHLDSSLNNVDEYDNRIYISGGNTTEFISNYIEMPYQDSGHQFNKSISENEINIIRIPSETIVKYDGGNVHRSPTATIDGKRLLIRLINTDKILHKWIKTNPLQTS